MSVFGAMDISASGMTAQTLRRDIISQNIANATTPNYKRQDVQFESYLMTALAGESSLDEAVATIDLSDITATTYTEYAGMSYRMDGNNVDIATENAELAKNQLRYYTLVDAINKDFNAIKTVLTSK